MTCSCAHPARALHVGARFPAALRLLAALIGTGASASAVAADAFALMKASDARHRLAGERTEAEMLLQKKGQSPRRRELVMLVAQDDKLGDRMRVRFSAPANVRGTALLSLENTRGGDDHQWLYLPAFRRTRRVGAAELGDRFVGTDFFYEDLRRRHVEDFRYKLLRSERLDAHDCWVIEARPHAPKVRKESPYGKSISWLRKDNLVIVRTRQFDRQLRPWKEIHVSGWRAVSGRVWRANRVVVTDIRRRHRTVVTVNKRNVRPAVTKSTFSSHDLGDPI